VIGRLLELRGNDEARAVRDPAWSRWANGTDLTSAAKQVDAKSALGLLSVYGCVQLIADSISTLPIDVLDGRDPQPLPAWLESPSPLDRVDLFGAVLSSLLLEGNAFVAVGRTSRGARITEHLKVHGAKMRMSSRELLALLRDTPDELDPR